MKDANLIILQTVSDPQFGYGGDIKMFVIPITYTFFPSCGIYPPYPPRGSAHAYKLYELKCKKHGKYFTAKYNLRNS